MVNIDQIDPPNFVSRAWTFGLRRWQIVKGIPGLLQGGDYIWERDWDILCVLDGCRTDIFNEVFSDLAGESDVMKSVGSTSQTWIRRTFDSRRQNLDDIAYITGNPFWDRIDTESFGYFHAEPVTNTEYDVETVPPDTLTRHAIDVWRRSDELEIDRMIIHYMQPHVPFRNAPLWFERYQNTDSWGSSIWNRVKDGELTREEVLDAYQDNLEWVREDGIRPLQQNCNATIALSADHGNAVGERGVYGHPISCAIPAVRYVPWATIRGTDEETIVPSRHTPENEINVESQLRALGYR